MSGAEVGGGAPEDVGALRAQIDELDRELVRLLGERARLGIAIGHAKAAAGLAIFDPDREREVLRRVREMHHDPIPDDDLVELYGRIIAITRQLEDPQRG